MPRVLTVDDSRAIRNLVTKQLAEMGCEVDEAEDGQQGLSKLEELAYDLIILDVTMPVMDGPTMLQKMREAENKTPVLMLTSESKKSIVAGVMQMGIDDYILKPFKPEELRLKVQKALKGALALSPTPPSSPVASSSGSATPESGRQFVDILVVDDMENVQKKLRSMIPPHVTLSGCVSAQTALNVCREKIFRVMLIDTDIPDVNSATLMNQLRTLQPHAVCLALSLRSTNPVQKEYQSLGFDDVIFKPFDRDSIDEFMMRYFDNQDLVVQEDNLLKIGAFTGKEDRADKYFATVTKLLSTGLEKVAAACFDDAVVDLRGVPAKPDRAPRLVIELLNEAKQRGVSLRLVAGGDLSKLLSKFDETASHPFFNSVEEARSAQAA